MLLGDLLLASQRSASFSMLPSPFSPRAATVSENTTDQECRKLSHFDRIGSTYTKSIKITCRFGIISFHVCLSQSPPLIFFWGVPISVADEIHPKHLHRRASLTFSASSLGGRPTSYFHAGVKAAICRWGDFREKTVGIFSANILGNYS